MNNYTKILLKKLKGFTNKMPKEAEVSICAIGDYRCHLLQISDFNNKPNNFIKNLHICSLDKSFELAMYYYARHCKTPNTKKGLFFICGNGLLRDAISALHIKNYIGDNIDENVYSIDVLTELEKKFNISMNYIKKNIYDTDCYAWQQLLGKDNVHELKDPTKIDEIMINSIKRYLNG